MTGRKFGADHCAANTRAAGGPTSPAGRSGAPSDEQSGQLELDRDPLRQASERELLSDVYEAAAILGMGDDGIGAHTAARLRGEILAAVRELARRWGTDVSA